MITSVRLPFLPKKTDEEVLFKEAKRKELVADMQQARRAMELAYANFDYVTDPALIDCSIYEVNAALERYKYLIKKAAELNLPPDSLHITLCEEASAASSFVEIDG